MQAVYRWFWQLTAGNPMVVRIVQGGSRRPRHLVVRMGYLGALIGLVLLGLITGGGLAQQVSLTDLAKAGARIFAIVAYGQVIFVCLLAPMFMAGAIAQEQAGKTFDILLTTPLSNLQIVLGSLLGRLFFIVALLLSGLPLFAVLLIFGGVPTQSIFLSFAVAGLVALMVGAVAVMMSVLRLGGRKAVFTFVIVIASYLVAAYVLDAGLLRQLHGGFPGSPLPGSTTWLTPLHPLLVLEASLNSANYQPPGPEYLADYSAIARLYLSRPFAAFAVLSITGSILLLTSAAVVLRNVGHGEAKRFKWLRSKLRLSTPGQRSRPSREVWANPIAWREANTRGKVASGIIARWGFALLAVLTGVVLLGLYHFDALPKIPAQNVPTSAAMQHVPVVPAHEIFQTALLALLMLEIAVVTLVALYMSAGSVSREREDGTLDLMLTTPITPKQYIWGKLRGLVSFLSMLIAVPVITVALTSIYALAGYYLFDWPQATYLHSAAVSAGTRVSNEPLLMLPEAAVILLAMLVPFVALCVMTGMGWSLKAKGVLSAIVPSVAVIALMTLVLGFCGYSAAEGLPIVGPAINAFSPATNVVMVINPWDHVAGFAENPALGRLSLAIAASVAVAGYSTIVYAMRLGMVKNFDQTVRKLSGR